MRTPEEERAFKQACARAVKACDKPAKAYTRYLLKRGILASRYVYAMNENAPSPRASVVQSE